MELTWIILLALIVIGASWYALRRITLPSLGLFNGFFDYVKKINFKHVVFTIIILWLFILTPLGKGLFTVTEAGATSTGCWLLDISNASAADCVEQQKLHDAAAEQEAAKKRVDQLIDAEADAIVAAAVEQARLDALQVVETPCTDSVYIVATAEGRISDCQIVEISFGSDAERYYRDASAGWCVIYDRPLLVERTDLDANGESIDPKSDNVAYGYWFASKSGKVTMTVYNLTAGETFQRESC